MYYENSIYLIILLMPNFYFCLIKTIFNIFTPIIVKHNKIKVNKERTKHIKKNLLYFPIQCPIQTMSIISKITYIALAAMSNILF